MSNSTSGIYFLDCMMGPPDPNAPSPLEAIYAEIEAALNAGLYYLAISVSVALPDICAALEGNVPTNWETYKTWFRQNVAHRFSAFGADECYELRCGVVHQAKFSGAAKQKHSQYDGVFFTTPGQNGPRIRELVLSQFENGSMLTRLEK